MEFFTDKPWKEISLISRIYIIPLFVEDNIKLCQTLDAKKWSNKDYI